MTSDGGLAPQRRRDFDRTILDKVSHRPWPMPDRPWIMTQTWHDLLFANWPIDPAALRARVPSAFDLDLFDGQAWLSVVPFDMSNVAPRFTPSLPGVWTFPEINVRTYVRVDDRPGVYFFSLDAANALAVRTARALLNLPYHLATMSLAYEGEAIRYSTRRQPADRAEFSATYAPRGEVFTARLGSLEYFLTERYCLYHVSRRGRPYRMDIHHPAWRLQLAEWTVETNSMADASGLKLPPTDPILYFSRRQDVIAWSPTFV